MAGDWIKMRCNLWDDPRVSGLADATKTKEATIIGGLYWLWATADQHTQDGFLQGMTLQTIDRKTGIKGFGYALESIGWAIEVEGGVTLPRFQEHNGASAKERAQTAKRVATHKKRANAKVTDEPLPKQEKGNGDSVTSALPREEKRRINTSAPSDPADRPAPEKSAGKQQHVISFADGQFSGLNGFADVWRRAYPAISIDAEVSKAAAWLVANPKNRKSNYARFLTNWLARAQDKAPAQGGGSDGSLFRGAI